jgi:hypothetical protein
VDSNPDATPRLQFETAVESKEVTDGGPERRQVTCAACRQTVADAYFDVNGTTVCETCHGEIARHAETPRGMGNLARAVVFGVVAMILGAGLYYAVVAITKFEIGIVAIAIGYMVGFAVRKGAGGGGRRFQVIAVLLTYWAVGLAYTPLAFREIAASRRERQQAEQAGAAVQVAERAEDKEGGRDVSVGLAVALLTGLSLTLPVLAVIGSLPGGLISAAIIAFGMLQAWRMTGTPHLVMTGPYRIAPETPAAS